MIEIAVLGALLTGLPLNHELVAQGGTFLRALGTRPCYRLFALAGGRGHPVRQEGRRGG